MQTRILDTPAARRDYPADLWAAEDALLKARRAAAAVPADAPEIGLSLSGGGLRSATFCLGVVQALARQGLLRRIDYLSTVSGGSYAGAFLSALYVRGLAPPAQTTDTVQSLLSEQPVADTPLQPVGWLRQNGRFLAPKGGTDVFRFFAIAARNWLAWQVAILSVLITLMALLALGGDLLAMPLRVWLLDALAESQLRAWVAYPLLSPWIAVTGVLLAVAVLSGGLYWLVDLYRLVPHQSGATLSLYARRARTWLTTLLAASAGLTLILAAWCLLDTLARHLYTAWVGDDPYAELPLVAALAALAGTPALRWLLTRERVLRWFEQFWSSLPKLFLLWPLALTLWSVVLLSANFAALWLLYDGGAIPAPSATASTWVAAVPWVLVLMLLAAQIPLMAYRYFLNRSSHHAVYAERLIRCYGGASNVQRQREGAASITEPMRGDDVDFSDWCDAARHGAPLHLINTTLSETRSDYAQTLLRDRNGVGLALGPCGVSAGVSHHAVYRQTRPEWTLVPTTGGGSFRMFGTRPFKAERLGLGYWTGISGAALATGLGSYGGSAQSLLLSFANLRLGYWWKAGTVGRLAGAPNGFRVRLAETWKRLRPTQWYLADEVLGRFWGPHVGRWYLTDGGHFENTGALELIRRRLPYIVVVDAEASPHSPTTNLAALVLKARQDYRAEIDFDLGSAPGPVGRLDQLAAGEQGLGRRWVATARVRYASGEPDSRLIYLRPLMAADDPPDLQAYRRTHPEFPYQSTGDQFFDEAQWESYRKLGERVAERAFSGCPAQAPEPFANLFGPYAA